jgi:hypothetical protein
MTEAVWHYLGEAWRNDLYPDGDLREMIDRQWSDAGRATSELVAGWTEVKAAEEDETDRQTLLAVSESYDVGGLVVCLPVMRQILAKGLLAVGKPAVESLQRRFVESSDAAECAAVALLLGEFGAASVGAVSVLTTVLAEPNSVGDRQAIRAATAYALGQIGATIDEGDAEEALPEAVEVLTRLALDPNELQSQRSIGYSGTRRRTRTCGTSRGRR